MQTYDIRFPSSSYSGKIARGFREFGFSFILGKNGAFALLSTGFLNFIWGLAMFRAVINLSTKFHG